MVCYARLYTLLAHLLSKWRLVFQFWSGKISFDTGRNVSVVCTGGNFVLLNLKYKQKSLLFAKNASHNLKKQLVNNLALLPYLRMSTNPIQIWPVLSPVALHTQTLVGDIRIAYTAAKNTNQGCHKQEAWWVDEGLWAFVWQLLCVPAKIALWEYC